MKLNVLSLPEQIYNRLLSEISSGQRKAGEKISEEHICEEYGISRTPVREVLVRLTQEGLLERKPRCGCFVKEFDNSLGNELFEARAMIEKSALEVRFDKVDKGPFKQLLTELKKVTPGKAEDDISMKLDKRMHGLIAASSNNRYIIETVDRLHLQALPFRAKRAFDNTELKNAMQERISIVSAIISGDKKTAGELLYDHIMKGISC